MADPRFYQRSGPFTLGAVAKCIGAVPADPGAAAFLIEDIAALDTARPCDLSLFYDSKHADAVRATKASAVVTTRALRRRARPGLQLLLAEDPRLAFALAGYLFYPVRQFEPGIDGRSVIASDAKLGPECRISPGVVIGARAEIGPHCDIGPNAVIGPGVTLGADCRIGPNTIVSHALIGARVEIGSCCTIGGPGFGFAAGPAGLLRLPQLGRVIIEDNVRIDSNCAVDRGANGDTVIGAGTVIDNLVQIGHNVRIGKHCAIAGQAGIAGSSVIGDGVLVGGQAGISDHLTIGSRARIALKAGVCRDVEAGAKVGGFPALAVASWHRQTVLLNRLVQRSRPLIKSRLPRTRSAHVGEDPEGVQSLVEESAT